MLRTKGYVFRLVLTGLLLLSATISLFASNLDAVGVTTLRQADPTLLGSGIYVAQAEAPENTNPPPYAFEVNPATPGQPGGLFTYYSDLGTTTNFPNTIGVTSGHAGNVANNYYSPSAGVAPQVAHVDNYEADYFIDEIVVPNQGATPAITARVVNQSFVDAVTNEVVDNQLYDNYVAQHGTLFVSGIGNGDRPVSPPATCFNGIGVGVSDGGSSSGPTSDGRSKPDLVAPGGATSFSTPYVSGSAAVLLQAAARGDGGANTNAAGDARTIKALLLNGAVKPTGWTNGPTAPLDRRYGAGILNVFNSWKQLGGGKQAFIESTSMTAGAAHPPGANPGNIPVFAGWDFNTLSTTVLQDGINHYYFNAPVGTGEVILTATLVWMRQNGQSNVNDLNLFLYDTVSGSLISDSVSTVDNVEHIYVMGVPAGRYDLQVLKHGSLSQVSGTETYALAFEFVPRLTFSPGSGSAVFTWPITPAGYHLQASTNLQLPNVWAEVSNVTVTNLQNRVVVPLTGSQQYFRLLNP